MNNQEPSEYLKAVELWQARQILGCQEAPPNREDYPPDEGDDKFFARTAVEATKYRLRNHADEYQAEFPKSTIHFYEVVLNCDDLALRKHELGLIRQLINLQNVHLICDRLFFGMSSNNSYYGDPNRVAAEIESCMVALQGFRIVPCDWIEGILKLFMRSPFARRVKQVAQHSKEQCGHEWTFDELLATVAIGEFENYQQMQQKAIDALTKAPPPMIIIKDEAEIERLKIQYQPKKES